MNSFNLALFKNMRGGGAEPEIVEGEEEITKAEETTEEEEAAAAAVAASAEGEEGEGEEGEGEGEDESSLDDRIAAMKAELTEEFSAGQEESDSSIGEPATTEEETPLEAFEFIGATDDMEAITESKDALNTAFNRVYQQGVKIAKEQMLKEMTDMRVAIGPFVQKQVQSELLMQGMVKDLHTKNPDLSKYPKTIVTVANTLASENPEWSTKKIFKELPIAVREKLRLPAKATEPKAQGEGTKKKKAPISIKGGSTTRRTEGVAAKKGDGSVGAQFQEMRAARGHSAS